MTTGLVKESQFDVFCLEDLSLNAMKKVWGRKVSDLSYCTFQQMLSYKCVKHGKKVIKIGRFEPSSQICHCCGHRQKMPLDVRTYECPECGMKTDRDLNAAINIRNFALRDILKFSEEEATAGTAKCNAHGDGSSGKHDASHACETAVNEVRKSGDCNLCKEEHLKITPFKV